MEGLLEGLEGCGLEGLDGAGGWRGLQAAAGGWRGWRGWRESQMRAASLSQAVVSARLASIENKTGNSFDNNLHEA